MDFSHRLKLNFVAEIKTKKALKSSLIEAVLIFTHRENTQVTASTSVFCLDPIISIFNGATLLPESSIWMSGGTKEKNIYNK